MGKIIKNLSVRKTILLYLMLSLICSYSLSSYISHLAWHAQAAVWRNYTEADKSMEPVRPENSKYAESEFRVNPSVMTPSDRRIDNFCDFLQTYTSQNNLQFQITYESKDEMGRLCREFERMRAQLAENNILLWRSLDEERFLRAAIAHDIRSPLSVLMGYHEMLTDYLPGESVSMEKAMEMLSECGKQLERMDKFVETMRKLSSLERRELCPDELTADQLQADLLAEISILEQEAGKRIILHAAPSEESFRGDKEIILEVTENLLSNALRYARETVEITLSVKAAECRICVTDDGRGFPASTDGGPEAFYQQNIKDSLKHAGIGMYISRLYCERHGGRLMSGNLKQGGASVTAVFGRIM